MPTDTDASGATQADATGADQSQADTSSNSQAGSDTNQQQSQAADIEPISLEAARKLRSENQSLRTRLSNLEKADELRKQGEMTELQKAQAERDAAAKERDDAKAEARTARAMVAAAKAGAVHADLVVLKLPANVDITNEKALAAALQEIRKEYPVLFRQGSADAGTGNDGRPPATGMNQLIRQAAGRN